MIPIPKPALCGCMMDFFPRNSPLHLKLPGVDLLEWRLDTLADRESPDAVLEALGMLASADRHPVVATNRPTREGGAFQGDEASRIEILRKAAESGAEWVDLENDVPRDSVEWVRSTGAQILLSFHDFSGTPDRPVLGRLLGTMAAKAPGAVKITTYARSPEDNLRVLELIPLGRREYGIDVIAFCMGPLGRWSRAACVLLGSPWTYVQLPGHSAAAPGQFTAPEMRHLLEALHGTDSLPHAPQHYGVLP